MKKIVLYTLLFSGANVLLILLPGLIGQRLTSSRGHFDLGALIFAVYNIWYSVALLAELIVGSILVANSKTKEIGMGLLLSAAIMLLVGLSVCSSRL
jgi:hypothetical protein